MIYASYPPGMNNNYWQAGCPVEFAFTKLCGTPFWWIEKIPLGNLNRAPNS